MTRFQRASRCTPVALLVAMGLAVASTARASASQTTEPAAENTAPDATVPVAPLDLERIRRALDSGPGLRIDDSQLRYFVQIIAKQRTFADYVKGYDLRHGPTKGGNPMTHQEFLNLVTPKEFYSSGGITAWEQLQFALTNYLGQTLVQKAIDDIKAARTQREVDDIRARIERELAALRRKPAPATGEPANPAPESEP